jgi:hypothetical protein
LTLAVSKQDSLVTDSRYIFTGLQLYHENK